MAKSLHERQVERLAAVRRDYGNGKATAKQVGEVLKTCTESEVTDAAEKAGSMDGVLKKLGRLF